MKQTLMKRILSFVLTFGLVLSCAAPVAAAEVSNQKQEVQVEGVNKSAVAIAKKDLDATATILPLNQAVTGVLEKVGEVDYYKFSITQKGYFNVKFAVDISTNPSDIHGGWDVEIYKEDDLVNPLKSITGITADYEFPKLPMGAGNYYVKVSANSVNAPTDCAYLLTAAFTSSNTWETEGNDEQKTANEISVDTVYSGNLHHSEDIDCYKVNVTTAGVIQFSFAIGKDSSADLVKSGWNVEIYNSDYQAIKVYGGIKKDFTAQILPFSEGTYYIRVFSDSDFENALMDTNSPVDCTYNIELKSIKSSVWESETNEVNTAADTIKVNKEYKGLLYAAGDVDWYKVKTTKKGYFKIHFTLDETVNVDDIHDGWNITLYDANFKQIITYSGIKASLSGGVIPYAKGTYYIKIAANNNYNGSAPTDCIYHLQVEQKESSVWESEGNDERKTADSISLNKTYKGLFIKENDEDWFKFKTKAAGTVKVTLKLADTDAADSVYRGWNVYIYQKSSATPVKEITGITNKNSVTVDLKKGTYYVRVTANSVYSGNAPLQCIYGLTVNYSQTPDKVTIKSVTAGTKKATLKWKKVENADGYIIYRSTSKNGKYTKVKTIKKNTTVKYVDKSVKSGKKYYYKIVSYKKTNGVTAKAGDSKIKSVRVK